MHDKVHKKIIPVAEFFSIGHDAKTIASYLFLIKDELENLYLKEISNTLR
jgi:hypothetical protein